MGDVRSDPDTPVVGQSGTSYLPEEQALSREAPDGHITQVFTARYTYEVCFTRSVFDPRNSVLARSVARLAPDRCHALTVFIDEGVAASWPELALQIESYVAVHAEQLRLSGAPMVVPGGEPCKSDRQILHTLYRRLHDGHVDRHSFVVAIGGGAVLDAVGFVAATTHRGIRLVRIPTTVLAQNDSGVGIKNGINLFEQKNFVGTFALPFAVINDIEFIETLHPRDRIAGMAEAVKVALIRDQEFFTWLERNADALALFERTRVRKMIRRCAELHMHQIAHGGDPFETGSVRPLDYGHWAAHRLESLTGHQLRHGEAVAIGIALDSRYSVLSGRLGAGEEVRICSLLENLGFRLWHPALEQTTRAGYPAVLQGLQDFREHLGGELTVTLLAGIGTGMEVHEMDRV